MTDEQIIKALKCLHKRILKSSFSKYVTETEIMGLVDALDLINRKNAEIERLTIELKAMRGSANSYKMHYEKARKKIELLQYAIAVKIENKVYDHVKEMLGEENDFKE